MKPKTIDYSSEEEVARLAESGDPVALEIMALATEFGFNPSASPLEDPKRAFELWKKASDLGSPKASFHLAQLLESGHGGHMDKKLSSALFKRAEKAGFLTEQQSYSRLQANKSSSAKIGGTHVLVIDSHDLDIQRLIVLLKDHGCYVSHVKNGAQGLEFLSKSSDVKLIFTELGLQLMGGIEFLKRLRSSDNKDLPVVIYSSDASKEHIVEAKKQKIMGWLMKPVSKIKLDEIMKMVATTQKKLDR
jgi:CheY-like chemotaxis protein